MLKNLINPNLVSFDK